MPDPAKKHEILAKKKRQVLIPRQIWETSTTNPSLFLNASSCGVFRHGQLRYDEGHRVEVSAFGTSLPMLKFSLADQTQYMQRPPVRAVLETSELTKQKPQTAAQEDSA